MTSTNGPPPQSLFSFLSSKGSNFSSSTPSKHKHDGKQEEEKNKPQQRVSSRRNKSGRSHLRTMLLEKSSGVEQLWLELTGKEKGRLCSGGGGHGPHSHFVSANPGAGLMNTYEQLPFLFPPTHTHNKTLLTRGTKLRAEKTHGGVCFILLPLHHLRWSASRYN